MGKCFSKRKDTPRNSLPIEFDFKTPFDHIHPIDLDSPLFNTPRDKHGRCRQYDPERSGSHNLSLFTNPGSIESQLSSRGDST
jgi:hypothetical protein